MNVEAPYGAAVRPCAVSYFAPCGEAQPGPAIAVARIGLIGHFGVLSAAIVRRIVF